VRLAASGTLARSYSNAYLGGEILDTDTTRGLLGLFLADGHLHRMRTPTRYRIRAVLEGGGGEIDFLQEKANELRRYIPTNAAISPYNTSTRENGSSSVVHRLRVTSDALQPIYNLLYPRGERQITSPVLELLGGRAAAWHWAENARPLAAGGFTLKRVGTTEAEAGLIGAWLRTLTGAQGELLEEADTWRRRQKPRLVFEGQQAAHLQTALLPYAPVSRRALFLPPGVA
jgi:hypothetical protein